MERDKVEHCEWPVLEEVRLSGCNVNEHALDDLNRRFKLILFHMKEPKLIPSQTWVANSSRAFWA